MARELSALATVADYQFGTGAGAALFDGAVEVRRTSSGRPQQVLVEHYDGHLVAVGRAELSAAAMGDFESGMAVSVREGVPRER